MKYPKGGSSGMNFYTWTKPPAVDVDAIESLGNPGWNFKEYMKYSMMSETYLSHFSDLTIYAVNAINVAASIPQQRTNSRNFLTCTHPSIAEPPGLFILLTLIQWRLYSMTLWSIKV
jgi:hypothetical protein